jgi:hypothetical protein
MSEDGSGACLHIILSHKFQSAMIDNFASITLYGYFVLPSLTAYSYIHSKASLGNHERHQHNSTTTPIIALTKGRILS